MLEEGVVYGWRGLLYPEACLQGPDLQLLPPGGQRGWLLSAGGRDTSFTRRAPQGAAKCYLLFLSLLFYS